MQYKLFSSGAEVTGCVHVYMCTCVHVCMNDCVLPSLL